MSSLILFWHRRLRISDNMGLPTPRTTAEPKGCKGIRPQYLRTARCRCELYDWLLAGFAKRYAEVGSQLLILRADPGAEYRLC